MPNPIPMQSSPLTLGVGVPIDVSRLIETRAIVTANSGGGKSWLLRRLLEQTHGKCQQIVIDPEGEFFTLRNSFDYILAGKVGADCPAEPRSASLLARKLLQLGISAIIDIFDLKLAERRRFVKLFLDGLIDAPRELWHPALIVIDEAHVFAPEKGDAESSQAVIDLATRGRKRGFCPILATQRPAMLAKDASAQCINKLIGRQNQDVDVKRAGDDLGFMRSDYQRLQGLKPGEFFVSGPAFCGAVQLVKVGPVQTEHPRAGSQTAPPPPPREKVKAVLTELAEIPREAVQEAQTIQSLQAKVRELEREAKRPTPAVDPAAIEKACQQGADAARKESLGRAKQAHAALKKALEQGNSALEALNGLLVWDESKPVSPVTIAALPNQPFRAPSLTPPKPVTPKAQANGNVTLATGERKILTVLAQHRDGCESGRLTLLTGYRYSGGFRNMLSSLRTSGYITGDNTGVMRITNEGESALGSFDPLPTDAELRSYWLQHPSFGKCERAVLGRLFEIFPRGESGPEVASAIGYEYSGGFRNALSALRTAGVMLGSNTGELRASEELFQ